MSSSLQAAYGLSSSWSRHRAHTYIILSTLSCKEIEAGEEDNRQEKIMLSFGAQSQKKKIKVVLLSGS